MRLPRLLTWGSSTAVIVVILLRYVCFISVSFVSSQIVRIRAHGCVPVSPPAGPQLQLTLVTGKQLRQSMAHRVRGLLHLGQLCQCVARHDNTCFGCFVVLRPLWRHLGCGNGPCVAVRSNACMSKRSQSVGTIVRLMYA